MINIRSCFFLIIYFTISFNARSQKYVVEKYLSINDSIGQEIKSIKKNSRICVRSQNNYVYDGKLKEVSADSIFVSKLNWVGDEKAIVAFRISEITEIGFINVTNTVVNHILVGGGGNSRSYKVLNIVDGKYKILIKEEHKKIYEETDSD